MQTTIEIDDEYVKLYTALRAHGTGAFATMKLAEVETAQATLEARISLYEEKLRGNLFRETAEQIRQDLHWYRNALSAAKARLEALKAALVAARVSMITPH